MCRRARRRTSQHRCRRSDRHTGAALCAVRGCRESGFRRAKPNGGLMERREEELIRQHLDHDEELRAAYEEHLRLKDQLQEYRKKHYLTIEEEMEEKRIHKLKLATKDRMMAILSRYQARGSLAGAAK